jgi:hypothetical protein
MANPWEVASEAPAQPTSQPAPSDNQWQVAGQTPSSSGQPVPDDGTLNFNAQTAPQPSASDQIAQQEGEALQGAGAGVEETATGLAKIGSHIPGVSYLSDKIGNALGLPKLGNNANPYDVAQQIAQGDVNKAKSTTGGWIGYGGENLMEFISGDEALKGLSLAEKWKAASDVAGIFEKSPKLMHAAQVGAMMLRHGAVQGAETLAKTGGNVEQAMKEGVTQALVSGVLGGAGATVSGLAEKAAPEAEKIAGVEVPKTPLNEPEPSLKAKILKPFATPEGAQKAIDTQTQPQAVKATVANLDQSALNKINDLRGTRGEGPAIFEPNKTQTVDDISNHLHDEAQTTYKKFDKVSDQLHTEWQQQVKDIKARNAEATQFWKDSQVSDEGAEKPSIPKPEDTPIPPEPESFSDIQSEIQKARKTLKSNAPSDAKEAAIDTLNEYGQKIEDFADQHGERAGVSDSERVAANKAYKSSVQYSWINNRLQSALTNPAGVTGEAIGKVTKVNPSTLKSMPGQFDKKFGTNAFRTSLGPEGWNNYNKVVKALENPIVRSQEGQIFQTIAQGSVGAGLGSLAGGPIGGTVGAAVGSRLPNIVADRILFSPKEGSMFLKLADKAVKAAKPLSPAIKQQVGQAVMGKPSLANILSGASEPLSNGVEEEQPQSAPPAKEEP